MSYLSNVNQSTFFLCGLVPYTIRGKVSIYVGHQEAEPEEWGKYLYLIPNELQISVEAAYSKYSIPIEHVKDDCFRVKVDEETYMNIVYPFLQGKYTQISGKYIDNTFPSKGNPSYHQNINLP